MINDLKEKLKPIKGKIKFDVDMAKIVWFRTGGLAQILFEPENEADLALFLKIIGTNFPLQIIGIGSNLLVRDGGLSGAVIRLNVRNFGEVKQLNETHIFCQCGVPGKKLSLFAAQANIGGFHFYSGIPGNLGGALAMNAGANNLETSQFVISVRAMNRQGEIKEFNIEDMQFSYRHCGISSEYIFLSAVLKGYKSSKEEIQQKIKEVEQHRNEAQPVREKTGGSTFKNLTHKSAWQAIDEAGGRGLCIGDACMSEKHCNFMINKGNASAFELEQLGELIREKVYNNSQELLEWEIQRIGNFKNDKIVKTFNKK